MQVNDKIKNRNKHLQSMKIAAFIYSKTKTYSMILNNTDVNIFFPIFLISF